MPLNAPAPMAPAPFARASLRVLGPPRISSPPLSCQPMQGQGAQMRPAASSPLALPGVGSPPLGRQAVPASPGLAHSARAIASLQRQPGHSSSTPAAAKISFFAAARFAPLSPAARACPPWGAFFPAGGLKRGSARLFALTQRPASGRGAAAFCRSGLPGPGGFRSPVPGPCCRTGAANRGCVYAG